jgi:tetratricopeptide (TPR) repeat protein
MISAKSYLPIAAGLAFVIFELAPAMALSPQEIGQVLKPSIVQIVSDKSITVSGTIIQHQGSHYSVLTTSRILDGKSPIKIITSDGNNHAVVETGDYLAIPGIELAVLRFNSNQEYKPAILAQPISLTSDKNSSSIFIVGYPQSTETITTSVYTLRSATPTTGGGYKANLLPGMEGGGIFNSSAVMIGVIGHSVSETNRPDTVNSSINFQDVFFKGIPLSAFTSLPASRSNGDYIPPTNFAGAIDTSNTIAASQAFFADAQILAQAGNHLRRGRYQQAIEGYSTYIASHQKEGVAYAHRGNAKFKAGDKQGAIADYDMAFALDPTLTDVLRNRAIAKAALGDRAGALADAEKTVQIKPNEPEYAYLLGLAYFENGRKADSIKLLMQAADLYQRQGKISKAIKTNSIIDRIRKGNQ